MASNTVTSRLINYIVKKFLALEEDLSRSLESPKKILVVRQHNQLGDLLTCVPLFRALKESYPKSHITFIASPVNFHGMVNNRYIDRMVIFRKNKLLNPFYFFNFKKIINEQYDIAIVPVTVSISYTSNLLARLANAKIRIGPESLDGKENTSSWFFDRRIKLDWRKHPDSHFAERTLDIVRPFGINTDNYFSEITTNESDFHQADKFITKYNLRNKTFLAGLHIGAGKPQNRWSVLKFASLIKKLNQNFLINFYFTGSKEDRDELDLLQNEMNFELNVFLNMKISEIAALISISDLFISNDTGIMHVAGATSTPQISIFGPTNPFNWAPLGSNKYFVRKSELIEDVAVEDVYRLCERILKEKGT